MSKQGPFIRIHDYRLLQGNEFKQQLHDKTRRSDVDGDVDGGVLLGVSMALCLAYCGYC